MLARSCGDDRRGWVRVADSGGLKPAAGRSGRSVGFEVVFAGADGGDVVRMPLAQAVEQRFEAVSPVRGFPSYRGQRNYPGFYYAACSDGHVPFESWLERDEAMALDFDPMVVGFAAQPFWLSWSEVDRECSHAPDFFARRADGTGVVIDCRPADRIKPKDQVRFTATRRACAEVGWSFRLVTGHDPVWRGNVAWLAGYRHRRHWIEPLVTEVCAAFATARPLMDGAAAVGDPIAVLPVVYHLLWLGHLRADLAVRLDGWSVVSGASRR
jgi:hypothetical protein